MKEIEHVRQAHEEGESKLAMSLALCSCTTRPARDSSVKTSHVGREQYDDEKDSCPSG